MKIEIVAKNFNVASDYLRNNVGVTGRALYHKVGVAKVWHGDVLSAESDRGDVRNIYSVSVDDQTTIQQNVQYVA